MVYMEIGIHVERVKSRLIGRLNWIVKIISVRALIVSSRFMSCFFA